MIWHLHIYWMNFVTMHSFYCLLFTGWPAELAGHRDVVFHGSDINYLDRKNGHLRPWPPSGGLDGPFPKDYWLPCPCGWCRLVPILLRHGRHSMLPLLHSVYFKIWLSIYKTFSPCSISSLTGSVLKNCSTITSIGTSLPWGRDCFVDVNSGHSLHKCQAVSIFSSRQHWHVWIMFFSISWYDGQIDHDQLWIGRWSPDSFWTSFSYISSRI